MASPPSPSLQQALSDQSAARQLPTHAVKDAVLRVCVPIWRAIARNTVVFDYKRLARINPTSDEKPVRYAVDIATRERYIVDIPDHLDAHRIPLEDRWKCDVASMIMLPILKDLLADKDLEPVWHTVDYIVKPNKVYLPADDADESTTWHTVIQLTLGDGSIHIIDLTGSQFGFDEVLVPWNEYRRVVNPDGPVSVDRIIDPNSSVEYERFCHWLGDYVYNLYSDWKLVGTDIGVLVGVIDEKLRSDAMGWWVEKSLVRGK